MSADAANFGLPIAALVLSAASLTYNQLSGRKKANQDYTAQLERRLDDHEKRLEACETARDNLMHENITLLRELRTTPVPPAVVVQTQPPPPDG